MNLAAHIELSKARYEGQFHELCPGDVGVAPGGVADSIL